MLCILLVFTDIQWHISTFMISRTVRLLKVICDHLFISPVTLTARKQSLFHCPRIFLFFPIYSSFLECLIVGLINPVCFSAYLHSLRDMNERILWVSCWLDHSLLFRTEYYFLALIYQSLFIHSYWLFSSFVIMTNVAINIPLQVFFFFFKGYRFLNDLGNYKGAWVLTYMVGGI